MGLCISKRRKPTISSNSVSVVVYNKAQQTTIPSESAATTRTNDNDSPRPSRVRVVQNFVLLWLDSNFNKSDADFNNSLSQLRQIVNTINTFTDPDQCVDFLTQIKDEKAFMIVSGALSQSIVPRIHDKSELDSIYVFCEDKSKYAQWTTEWAKVKGVFTQIEPICDTLKRDTQQCDYDSISISVTRKGLDRLEPSFMYTQLLKEMLFDMEYDKKAKTELTEFCREQYRNNPHELLIINEFERDYHVHTPIWWYTRECFTYQMLNRALCIQDVEIIIKMGFFLHDVHRHIEELHSQTEHHDPFTVYRGKGMSNAEFDEIRNREGGLLAFNNFLSTSLNENVALLFAKRSIRKSNLVGILFQITVDPSISSTPFASVGSISFVPKEEEVLFSMHTVFRIGQIKQIEDRIWRVELALTSDDDQELKRLTEHMRQETAGSTRWNQLGQLLIKMGNFNQAEEVYKILLEETSKDDENVHSYYYYLGEIKCNKGNYKEALEFYQKDLEIKQKYLSPDHPDLAITYNGIGLIHDHMGEYSKALDIYQKSLEIQEKLLPPNQSTLSETYNNIGAVYCSTGEHLKALDFYQKSLEISLQSLPSNHPDLATTYSNIGLMHNKMGEYSNALEFYQKSLEIRQTSLPPTHPDMGVIYSNIGLVHCNTGEFSKALDFYQKDLEIKQKSLPPNHSNFAITYNNIGLVHWNMRDYPESLQFYERAVEVGQHSLPQDHPYLQSCLKKLAEVRTKCNSI